MAKLQVEIEIPEGIQVQTTDHQVVVSANGNETTRKIASKKIQLKVDGSKVVLSSDRSTKRELTMVGTFKAHLKNMFKGVTEGHQYKLKICSGHFPMNVSVSGNEFVIKNFLGEAVPRRARVPEGVKVEIQGTDVVVSGINKEYVGGFAGKLELLTKIKGRDSRIFQDGIYIVEKDGKAI